MCAQSKSVVNAAVIERLARSVGELSGGAGLEALAALWSLFFPHLASFHFAAGKTVGPAAHDSGEKPSKPVVDAAVIEYLA